MADSSCDGDSSCTAGCGNDRNSVGTEVKEIKIENTDYHSGV